VELKNKEFVKLRTLDSCVHYSAAKQSISKKSLIVSSIRDPLRSLCNKAHVILAPEMFNLYADRYIWQEWLMILSGISSGKSVDQIIASLSQNAHDILRITCTTND